MKNTTVTAPKGFLAGTAACGIKTTDRLDLGILAGEDVCAAAAVFTSNRFCGAPVVVGREHVRGGRLRGIVVNSGCSNVATGQRGISDARKMCALTAKPLETEAALILPSSTGVIGRFLPMDKVAAGIADAAANLEASSDAGERFARAIMTTDLTPKLAGERVRIGKEMVTIAGCCKGSGMIAPNMATMLGFLTTDAGVAPPVLRKLLKAAVEPSFNRVTVDECQSTSDTVVLLASGRTATLKASADQAKFARALLAVCDALAYQIAADGEGATRVLEVKVSGAKTAADAHEAARAIAVSPLVRTAVHGGDPNWGRIVQALGQTRAVFYPEKVVVRLGGAVLFRNGAPAPKLDMGKLSAAMRAKHVTIAVDLAAGKASDRVLTCDLTREYIAINADYTT